MGSLYDDRLLVPSRDHEELVEPEPPESKYDGPSAWAQFLALRAAQVVLDRSPRLAREAVFGALARLCRRFDRRHSDGARGFVRTALPERADDEVEALVLEAWKHLMRVAVSSEGLTRRLMGRRFGEHFELHMSPAAREVAESGAGCVLLTAHVGNWEAMGFGLHALGFAPIYMVSKPPRNGPLARHLVRRRMATGGGIIPRRGAMSTVPRVVRAGGSVVMMLDHRSRAKPAYAPFFGREAACDRSAGVLARRVRAPLVFFACYVEEFPARFSLELPAVIQPDELVGLAPEAVVERINRELEGLILARPEQYFWLHDRFKGTEKRAARKRARLRAVRAAEACGGGSDSAH